MRNREVFPIVYIRYIFDPQNYRPISLLPLVSKIIERSIHNQFQEHLKENSLLYKYQSSFRATFSTGLCLKKLTDIILIHN